jgi:O-antigen ligase
VLLGVVLTAMTTARAGLLGLIVGMVAIAVLMRQMKLFIVLAALSALLALLVAAARPELIELATNRLLGRNIYMLDTSADAMTSGRLTLQAAALLAYLDFPWTGQLFGVGTSASMQAIGRYSGFYLIAHNAFVDELIAHGALGLMALLALFGTAGRLAWKNARAGQPAGFSIVLAFAVYAVFQGVDYSLQLSIVGLVLYLETHARVAARRHEA